MTAIFYNEYSAYQSKMDHSCVMMESITENMNHLHIENEVVHEEEMKHVEEEMKPEDQVNSLQLSRYLYRKDEIELMIIQHLGSMDKCPSDELENNSISEYHSMDMTDVRNEIMHIEKNMSSSANNGNTTCSNKIDDPMLFWISEYVESYHFDEVWEFLWKLYYDFYAVHFPEMYNMIVSCYNDVHYLKNLQPTIYVEEQFMSHLMRVVIQVLKTMQSNVMDPKVFSLKS